MIQLSDRTEVQLAINQRLIEIAEKAGPFSTDEDDLSLDPESSLFDLTNDPFRYVQFIFEEIKSLRQTIDIDHPKNKIDAAQQILSRQVVYLTNLLGKYIAGKNILHRGQNLRTVVVSPVPKELQSAVLDYILSKVISSIELFPQSNWVRLSGECGVYGEPQQYCYGIQPINGRNHTMETKKIILTNLFQRSNKFDEENPLPLREFFSKISNYLFQDFTDTHTWNLQVKYIQLLNSSLNEAYHNEYFFASVVSQLKQISKLISDSEGQNKENLNSHFLICTNILEASLKQKIIV